MANKATHEGHCQVCGRLQKLPNGVLAKHGYNVMLGFFNGICWGSGHRPFEQAIDCIEKAIGWATDQRNDLHRQAAEVFAAPMSAENVPYYRYVVSKRRGVPSGYHETTATLVKHEYASMTWDAVFSDGKSDSGLMHRYCGTLEHVVLKFRTNRVQRIGHAIKNREEYIAWQQSRIKDWKEQPLKEVGA